MGIAVLTVRLALASVFALAGAAKLADRRGSREAVVAFGVPRALAGFAALALPLSELSVAAALLPASSASWGLAGASVLLGGFTGAIAFNMARGRTPDCHCFGQLHSEPAGPRTLARNAALLALAAAALVVAFFERGPSAVAWIPDLTIGEALLVAAGALALALGTALLLVRAQRRARPVGLPALTEMGLRDGSEAPDFALPGPDGSTITLSELMRRGAPVVLVFTDTECEPCRELVPLIAGWQAEHEGAVTIAVVNAGPPDGTHELAREHQMRDLLFDAGAEVRTAYEVTRTPAAVRIDQPAVIASPFTVAVGALVQTVVTGKEPTRGLLPGEPLPEDVFLEGPDGERVPLTDFAGEETLFLFWDPDCGSCREIRRHLLHWERDPIAGTPRVVVVTSGSTKEIRAEGFRSPIYFDRDRAVAEALEAIGTPMAVLADADGRAAWPLAAGPGYVLRLILSRTPVWARSMV